MYYALTNFSYSIRKVAPRLCSRLLRTKMMQGGASLLCYQHQHSGWTKSRPEIVVISGLAEANSPLPATKSEIGYRPFGPTLRTGAKRQRGGCNVGGWKGLGDPKPSTLQTLNPTPYTCEP